MIEEKNISFHDIKTSKEIRAYIKQADISLEVSGFTEHSFVHVGYVSCEAGEILRKLSYDEHIIELGRIAGYMHDIGNVINRSDYAHSGALMAFRILDKMGMPTNDIATIISAIGNHDENTAFPVNEVAAALIIADKTDVRRSRVRCRRPEFDIHDRVNYAVIENKTCLDTVSKTYNQNMVIDMDIASIMEYFEIYMERVLLVRRAAQFFGLQFRLTINGTLVC